MIINAKDYCPLCTQYVSVPFHCKECEWQRGSGERGASCLFNGMTKTEANHLIKLQGCIVQNETKIKLATGRIAQAQKNLSMFEHAYTERVRYRSEEE